MVLGNFNLYKHLVEFRAQFILKKEMFGICVEGYVQKEVF